MAYTTIDNPELYFQAKNYTGNASTNAITLDGSENMQPDMVWLKSRSFTQNAEMYDSVRGATKRLYPNGTYAEDTDTAGVTAFNSDGFTLGNSNASNKSGETFASWNWKESAVSGMDIVSYTGNATNRTISHSLSAVPKFMIFKRRSTAESWGVYHVSSGAGKFLRLDGNNAEDSEASVFNSTAPTSSVFSLGTSGLCNQNGGTYIGYLFSEIKGYSKFTSFVGNGNSDGPYCHLGFKPSFVIWKNSTGEAWGMTDNKRDPHNPNKGHLYPNHTNAEGTGNVIMDFLSNGIKIRWSDGNINANGVKILIMAFAESPFVTSTGIPTTAR